MVNDEVILSEAIRLVNDGVAVTFPVNGRSMLPFIVGGRDSVILEKPTETLKVGDVVLAEVEGGRHVVHRIVGFDAGFGSLMGDGKLMGREHCREDQIKAKVSYVVFPSGKKRSLDSFKSRFLAKIWFELLPLRRWLLAIYRRVFLLC